MREHPGAHALNGRVIAAAGPHPGQQWLLGVTVSELGTLLSKLADGPVLDKTGLNGKNNATYQIELPPPPPLVIDHVEQLSEN